MSWKGRFAWTSDTFGRWTRQTVPLPLEKWQCMDSAVAYALAEGQVTDSKALQMQELLPPLGGLGGFQFRGNYR